MDLSPETTLATIGRFLVFVWLRRYWLKLSAPTYRWVLKIARTIADLLDRPSTEAAAKTASGHARRSWATYSTTSSAIRCDTLHASANALRANANCARG